MSSGTIVLNSGRQEVLDPSLGPMTKGRIEGLVGAFEKTQGAYIEDRLDETIARRNGGDIDSAKYYFGIAEVAYAEMRFLGLANANIGRKLDEIRETIGGGK